MSKIRELQVASLVATILINRGAVESVKTSHRRWLHHPADKLLSHRRYEEIETRKRASDGAE